jgi:hypothetical protein
VLGWGAGVWIALKTVVMSNGRVSSVEVSLVEGVGVWVTVFGVED